MKRLMISSLLVICVAALVVSLGTFAYFSDSATSANNTFSTGTLYLNDWSTDVGTISVTNNNGTNIAPGDSRDATFTLVNNGTIAMANLTVGAVGSGALFGGATPATASVSCAATSLAPTASTSCTLTVFLPTAADNSYQNVSGNVAITATGTQN